MSNKKNYVLSHERKSFIPKAQSTKPAKSTNWLLAGFALSAVAVFSAAAGGLLALSLSQFSLQRGNLNPDQLAAFNQDEAISYSSLQLPKLSRPVNVLVLGVKVLTSDVQNHLQEDLGYHALVNSFEGLSDSMFLLRFDPNEDKVTMLSIPRDTRTEIPGHGVRKINDANALGGPALAAESVTNLLGGVEVDRYLRINVQGIEKLIDALGGVTIEVPKDMKYTDHSQHLYIDLKQGKHHLNGEQALNFLRFRYDAYGDIGRVQRQQSLIRAVIEQCLSPRTFVKLPEILSIVHSNLDTNLTNNELMALTAFASQRQRSDIKMLMVPGDFSLIPNEQGVDISYWQPHPNSIKTMMKQHFHLEDDFYASYSSPESYNNQEEENRLQRIRIAIQDSTNDPEAVAEMVKYLQDQGFRRVFVSQQNLNQPLVISKIIAQSGDELGASRIRANLGFGEILVESTGVLNSDVTIQLGQDWLHQQVQNKQYQNHTFQHTSF